MQRVVGEGRYVSGNTYLDNYSLPTSELPEQNSEIEESESEDSADYREGGYHPVTIGETFNNGRYVVLKKLGWGHFSTVWLSFDLKDKRHVAVKVQKSASHYAEAAYDEIKLLNELKNKDPEGTARVVRLLDHFEVTGVNGTHVTLVFEVLGKSILSLIRRCNFSGASIDLTRRIARHVLEGLDFIHTKCNIIHTDLKPENILFVPPRGEFERMVREAAAASSAIRIIRDRRNARRQRKLKATNEERLAAGLDEISFADDPEADSAETERGYDVLIRNSPGSGLSETSRRTKSELDSSDDEDLIFDKMRSRLNVNMNPDLMFSSGSVKIVDFGNACWGDQHFTDAIQTRQYRSPEVIISADYDFTADIWSVGCLLFEVATGDFLFDPHSGKDYHRDEDHLALMMELLGPTPANFAFQARRRPSFSPNTANCDTSSV
uniref:non-specific serine/threonine protein kinase n=1 Tax=Timspurckia oligopyrenoides TaxID=708627 RepID=A0A7S0ZEH3_9RHOD|mmetsp:Transcript_2169/g.3826  ORF Transcript_2169/g.3826 Transcript_2169/m.3826 type:complete len:436 (+) Transcript_2169:128-1435(+)|eukprot:CAMPEP_0182448296 /NCGR_PEP_ID=MMETSP1172-20130603/25668_1 /TAXON_ID=708627 /ORGANISM="Timspurckia oligopyrenoides, Strain CCMP3278" /LENGTH=435 /DNA_ID=CAMNT_0024645101 /DNA_START=558 /DNA_END=1865 /DNA_ORIENTATION=-